MKIAAGIVFHRVRGKLLIDGDACDIFVQVNADGQGLWRGFGENHNQLMRKVRGYDWYIAVNPDVAVSAADLVRLVQAAEDEDFSVVSPLSASPWGITGHPQSQPPAPKTWARETIFGAGADRVSAVQGQCVQPTAWVSGACMAIKLSTGLRFDERYFMYFEDVDLCRRAEKAGWHVGVLTSLTVDHASGWSASDPLVWRRGVEFARSAMLYAQVHGHSRSLMRLAGSLRHASRIVMPGRTASEAVAAKAISRGFATIGYAEGLSELARRYNERHT